ncbi:MULTISPECIES: hypothetical protein [unclassified Mesorhizobium]|uniref:hypothetical protein n=1 Tax=unclassified Mesorhizobium TaxID=325217 RepID=UPI0012EC637A|nr:hypothetical protein [Mesorhizobium sp. LSJC265A00]
MKDISKTNFTNPYQPLRPKRLGFYERPVKGRASILSLVKRLRQPCAASKQNSTQAAASRLIRIDDFLKACITIRDDAQYCKPISSRALLNPAEMGGQLGMVKSAMKNRSGIDPQTDALKAHVSALRAHTKALKINTEAMLLLGRLSHQRILDELTAFFDREGHPITDDMPISQVVTGPAGIDTRYKDLNNWPAFKAAGLNLRRNDLAGLRTMGPVADVISEHMH